MTAKKKTSMRSAQAELSIIIESFVLFTSVSIFLIRIITNLFLFFTKILSKPLQ